MVSHNPIQTKYFLTDRHRYPNQHPASLSESGKGPKRELHTPISSRTGTLFVSMVLLRLFLSFDNILNLEEKSFYTILVSF